MQVVETRKTNLEADHPSTLISIAKLSSMWKTQGRSTEAVVLTRQCIQRH